MSRGEPRVSHLFFVDENLIFGETIVGASYVVAIL